MHKRLILFLTCIGQFMVSIDIAIINVALPTIGRQMHLNESVLQWIVVAYSLLLGGCLLLGGRLGDLYGRRKVFMAGLSVFALASLIGGLARVAPMLIGARALQGFGAALIAPSALAILANTFTEGKQRNIALGIFGAIGGAAGSVGVFASGLLTDGPGWPWIFFINVPIGVLALALSFRCLPKDNAEHKGELNSLAAAVVTLGLGALVFSFTQGGETGWLTLSTIGSFILAVLLLATFIKLELRARQPLMPFEIFKNRSSTASLLSGLFVFGGLFSFIFLMTLFMQQVLHYSAAQTGLAWLATTITTFLVATLTGAKLVSALGVKRVLCISGFATVLAALLLARAPAAASYWIDLLPAFLLAGIGFGIAPPAIQIGALTGVKTEWAGLLSGMVETMREMGTALSIALVTTAIAAGSGSAHGFHIGLIVIAALEALGLVITAVAFRNKEKAIT